MTTPDESQIQICNDGPEPSDGKIVLCDPAPEPTDGTIVICEDQCGDGQEPLTISGTAAPIVGSTYTAAGGRAPYMFSISEGAIAPGTGIITSLDGTCGTGTVTVRDACGNQASLSVRFPSGQWVLGYSEACGPCVLPHCGPWPGCGVSFDKIATSGGTKTIYYYKRTSDCSQDYCGTTPEYPKVCPGQTFPDGTTNTGAYCACLYTVDHYTWECP